MQSDTALLKRYVLANDSMAFDQLARRYHGVVFFTAKRITCNHHDAEDVAQACFFELARRADSISTSVPAYLHASATNRALNVVRDRTARRKHERQSAEESATQTAPVTAPDRTWEEISPDVDRAIEELPEELRVPIILYYLRGLSEMDLAQELGLSRRAVVNRLQIGVRQLRLNLTRGAPGTGAALSIGALTLGLKSTAGAAVPASLKTTVGRMALVGLEHASAPSVWTTVMQWSQPVVACIWGAWFKTAAAIIALLCTAAVAVVLLQTSRPTPYDRMTAIYGPHLSPTRLPWRMAAMNRDATIFWRGAQPLFFEWCRDHASDWLADRDSYVLCHASPSLEDAGALPTRIDTANSTRLPFQIELLQGMVASRVESGVLTGDARAQLDREMFEAYRASLAQAPLEPDATGHGIVSAADIVRHVGDDGQLRPIVHGPGGKPAKILEPLAVADAEVAQALAQAMGHNPSFARLFASDSQQWIAAHIGSAAQVQRVNGAASQGMLFVMVFMPGALADGGDALIELHQVAPAAAELAGSVAHDLRSPGQRAAQDEHELAPGGPESSWCSWGDVWMLIRLHAPPRDGGDASSRSAAITWATATAATHRRSPNRDHILNAMTPALLAALTMRADAYAQRCLADFNDFRTDERARADFLTTESQMAMDLSQGYRSMRSDGGHTR